MEIGGGHRAFYPEMEDKLYQEFIEMRNNGMKV